MTSLVSGSCRAEFLIASIVCPRTDSSFHAGTMNEIELTSLMISVL